MLKHYKFQWAEEWMQTIKRKQYFWRSKTNGKNYERIKGGLKTT